AGQKESGQGNEFASFSFSELADGQVGSNAVDVSRERIAALVPVSGPVNSDKRLLSQIHSTVVIVGHSVDIARNLVSISTHQLCKSVLISRPCRLEQRVVRRSVFQHLLLQGGRKTQFIDGSQCFHHGRLRARPRAIHAPVLLRFRKKAQKQEYFT